MGFGGVTALGCTIGQGISGASTLALGSFLTLAAIIASPTPKSTGCSPVTIRPADRAESLARPPASSSR